MGVSAFGALACAAGPMLCMPCGWLHVGWCEGMCAGRCVYVRVCVPMHMHVCVYAAASVARVSALVRMFAAGVSFFAFGGFVGRKECMALVVCMCAARLRSDSFSARGLGHQ